MDKTLRPRPTHISNISEVKETTSLDDKVLPPSTMKTINNNNNNNNNNIIGRKSTRMSLHIGRWSPTTMFILLVLSSMLTIVSSEDAPGLEPFLIDVDIVRNMAQTLGRELSRAGSEQTCADKIEENFDLYAAEVSWFDANKMMDDMRVDVTNMLNWKRHAVERIANESERLAANHTYDNNIISFEYQDVKQLKDVGPLDTSAIHVPVNVYNGTPEVMNDIKWSDALTPFFKNNLAFDPSLSWQFFGSAKGFLRMYPATAWRYPPNYSNYERPDFYDARMRQWYIRGAASPKDIVVLVDSSGSMTGSNKDVANRVASEILDTLTDNDYVAVLKFSNVVAPVVPCFEGLVRANKRNLFEFKTSLGDIKPGEFVNFTAALVEAFNLLQTFNRSGAGSQCNQAIMLITDGAPDAYEEVFRQFNWPNIPVRVFTYLVGRDLSSQREVYWMACHNRGYYTHVTNMDEVHEQVQKYIPVLSRPIVLSGERIFSWTPVYSPWNEIEIDQQIWANKQELEVINRLRANARRQDAADARRQQPKAALAGQNKKTADKDSKPRRSKRADVMSVTGYVYDEADSLPAKTQFKESTLYTTLSTPVFDVRNYTNVTRQVLIKNVYVDTEPETIRIANLLGVAGIDVPIKEIEKLTPSFKLGVNGYAFVISNNGYVLNHPDLRPYYEDFLKPFYNSVDMSEVELANNTLGPRQPDPKIEEMRGNMINRTHGWKKVAVKMHLDEMRRVVTRVNHYTHGAIQHTPFSLAIVLPEIYGSYRLTSQVDLRMKHRVENFTQYFRGNQWRVHPRWAYCTNPQSRSSPMMAMMMGSMSPEPSSRPELTILQFLAHDLEKGTFRWRTSSIRPQVYETISCDKDLIQSLVLDAKLTDIPKEKCNSNPNFQDEQRIKTFGIATTFVATRSGLTRYHDYRSKEEIMSLGEKPFYLEHNRAIEEIYYKRAVDFYTQNKDAFVFSVEHNIGKRQDVSNRFQTHSGARFLVTATHPLFTGTGKQLAPVAVVGIQYRYNVLHEYFLNTTSKFNVPCAHLDVTCYLIDNNGFLVLSNQKVSDVGAFLGDVDSDVLSELVSTHLFRRVRMYDYQALCVESVNGPQAFSPSSFASSLIGKAIGVAGHLVSSLVSLYVDVILGADNVVADVKAAKTAAAANTTAHFDYSRREPLAVASDSLRSAFTQIRACDKEFDLYEMMDFYNYSLSAEVPCSGNQACTRKLVAQYVSNTNLVLVVLVNNPSCECLKKKVSIVPREVHYTPFESCRQLRTEKYRQRPAKCFNYHPQEKDIRQCGGAGGLTPSSLLSLLGLLLLSRLVQFHN